MHTGCLKDGTLVVFSLVLKICGLHMPNVMNSICEEIH